MVELVLEDACVERGELVFSVNSRAPASAYELERVAVVDEM